MMQAASAVAIGRSAPVAASGAAFAPASPDAPACVADPSAPASFAATVAALIPDGADATAAAPPFKTRPDAAEACDRGAAVPQRRRERQTGDGADGSAPPAPMSLPGVSPPGIQPPMVGPSMVASCGAAQPLMPQPGTPGMDLPQSAPTAPPETGVERAPEPHRPDDGTHDAAPPVPVAGPMASATCAAADMTGRSAVSEDGAPSGVTERSATPPGPEAQGGSAAVTAGLSLAPVAVSMAAASRALGVRTAADKAAGHERDAVRAPQGEAETSASDPPRATNLPATTPNDEAGGRVMVGSAVTEAATQADPHAARTAPDATAHRPGAGTPPPEPAPDFRPARAAAGAIPLSGDAATRDPVAQAAPAASPPIGAQVTTHMATGIGAGDANAAVTRAPTEAAPPASGTDAAEFDPRQVAGAGAAPGGQDMSIRLQTVHLGTVEVHVARDPDGASAITLSASRDDTLRVMAADRPQMHAALDGAGVDPDRRRVEYAMLPGGGGEFRDQRRPPPEPPPRDESGQGVAQGARVSELECVAREFAAASGSIAAPRLARMSAVDITA